MGAIPGLIFGLRRGLRWTIPFLGAAIGALVGMPISFTAVDINSGGIVGAGLVLLGFLAGIGLIAMRRAVVGDQSPMPDAK